MSILDALVYSLLGICVVFFALCLLIVIIKVLTYIPKSKRNNVPKSAAPAAAAAPASKPAGVPAPGSAGDLKLYDTDPRDAAMIMAIVADELGKPLNELRFISIREVNR